MAVHLTRIYTRTGDDGSTGLSDFSRVPKTDPRVVAYADCDEANATIGLALALGGEVPDDIRAVLTTVQNDLFDAGADLSTPVVEDPQYPPLRIAQDYIDALERWCDAFGAELPALDSFILPGGTPLAALLHQARTVTRRAERSAWAAVSAHPDDTSVLPAKYLNRLSDLLFILSRVANRTRGADSPGDVKWIPGGSRQRPASKSES
ncbi:cob(I)yrinic acid a,c-diamide adenosyltransferase [Gordonia terrae]